MLFVIFSYIFSMAYFVELVFYRVYFCIVFRFDCFHAAWAACLLAHVARSLSVISREYFFCFAMRRMCSVSVAVSARTYRWYASEVHLPIIMIISLDIIPAACAADAPPIRRLCPPMSAGFTPIFCMVCFNQLMYVAFLYGSPLMLNRWSDVSPLVRSSHKLSMHAGHVWSLHRVVVINVVVVHGIVTFVPAPIRSVFVAGRLSVIVLVVLSVLTSLRVGRRYGLNGVSLVGISSPDRIMPITPISVMTQLRRPPSWNDIVRAI